MPADINVVAFGGGHGLYTMLSALRTLPVNATAIVTVADDGGSSGRIRRDLPGSLPPGDLRMALAALAGEGDEHALWQKLFQHRYPGEGALAGHPVGNLVLAGLTEVLGSTVAALDAAGRMLGCRGRVLPMAAEPLTIIGEVSGLLDDPLAHSQIRGQVAVAATPGTVHEVRLEPAEPAGCPEAITAIGEADLIILGPGSWFTSVIPHLLVPAISAAIVRATAYRLLVLNLVPQPGETEGFSPQRHLDVLCAHAPQLRVNRVIAERAAVTDPTRLAIAASRFGAELTLHTVADPDHRDRHHPGKLAAVLGQIIGTLGKG